jgi:hypothetical protein
VHSSITNIAACPIVNTPTVPYVILYLCCYSFALYGAWANSDHPNYGQQEGREELFERDGHKETA